MKDLYTAITESIITALEQGTPPWICPWRQDSNAIPRNLVTGKPYRGINVLILSVQAMAAKHADSRWLTFLQATALGARIRKGEHGVQIVFYKLHKRDDHATDNPDADTGAAVVADQDNQRGIPLLKSYTVFNASQLDAIPERFQLAPPPQAWQPMDQAQKLLNDSGATILHGGNSAFYHPTEDNIHLPPAKSFAQASDYYNTALHELCHWTGHASRLNRVLGPRHEIEAYAYEELVAEIGAAFLCASAGIAARMQHASYVENWLGALRRDKRLIFVAAGAAQKAADFVLGAAASSDAVEAIENAVPEGAANVAVGVAVVVAATEDFEVAA